MRARHAARALLHVLLRPPTRRKALGTGLVCYAVSLPVSVWCCCCLRLLFCCCLVLQQPITWQACQNVFVNVRLCNPLGV